MLKVLALLLAADQVVVREGEAEGQVPEVLVNQALECLACITQSEWHKIILKQAKGGDSSGFRLHNSSNGTFALLVVASNSPMSTLPLL